MSDIIPERSNRDGNRNSPSRIDSLRHHIENVMKGFHGSNAIAYKNKNEYVTYSRPADCLRVSTSTDEFEPDNKQIWPVLNNMGASLPTRLHRRPNRADDPEWTVPVSDKTPIQTFPQSKGLKLRQVDEIINDKQLFNQFVPPSQHEAATGTAYRLPNSSTSSSSHTPKTLEPPLSTVQGVLNIITENSRKPNRPAVKKRSTASLAVSTGTNRPRKSSLLKSEITSASQKPTPTQVGSKKPMSLLTNNNNNRPRVSSKSTSAQKNKYNQDIPDLIEARNYLLEETDEVEYKKLDHLIEAQPNTRIMPRPKLFLHFKKSLPALQKAAEKYIPSGKAIEHEPTVNKKSGLPENPITSPLKNKHVDIPTNTSSTTTTSSASTVATPPPPPAIKKSLSDQQKTTQEKVAQDKPAYASSVTAAFLRKMKIPKRKISEIELEEGETVSPSPSPLHSDILPPPPVKSEPRRSRYENVETEEVASPSTQEPVVSSTPAAPAPATAAPASSSSSSSRKYSRREEERSSSRRRDRYSDDVRRASTSSKRSHYRSRSRSRSPKRSPKRSVSRRRQTSSESSRRPEKRKLAESSKYDEPTTATAATTTSSSSSSKRQRLEKESSSRDRDRLAEKERSAEKERIAEKERLIAEKEKLIAEKEKAALEKERLAVEKEKAAEKERLAAEKERLAAEKERLAAEKERAEKDRQAEKNRTTSSSTTAAEKESNSKKTSTTTSTEKTLSATAANAETPEQFKVFLFMFSKLAHANKRRGDGQTNPIFAMIDHFHAFCDYILNFYYVDRLNPTANFKQASIAWKSIFPFTDSLLKKLESQKEYELYGLCIRLNSLIRFYMYSRMESSTRPVLLQQMNNTNGEKMTDRACVELSENLLHEYEKAERAYKESERYIGFSTLVTQYPTTFRNVCMEGNLLAGITLGGEAGVSVTPMFPFAPYSPLHHAAIVAKCILAEYVTKNNLKYTPISKFDEFM